MKEKKGLAIWLAVIAATAWLAAAVGPPPEGGNRSFLTASYLFTGIVGLAALYVRLHVIPRFGLEPGRFQLALETLVGFFIRKPRPKPSAPVRREPKPRGPGLGQRLKKLPGLIGGWVLDNKGTLAAWLLVLVALFIGTRLTGGHGGHGDVQSAMKDAVVHDVNRVSLFSIKAVNPSLIAAMTVSGVLIAAAVLIRIFAIPHLKEVPGRFQLVLETAVDLLDGMAGIDRAQPPSFIGGYVFAAGVYIFVSTLFELLGLQAVTTQGHSVTLPAPLSDVNAAIAMGCLSYLVIVGGGAVHRGGKGVGAALKEFSLPISMSFRLFGALLSGLLVTDLVYHYINLSYVLPVIVGVLFTLLHALVQTYVLTMLVGMYYAEVSGLKEEE